jgi:flagellar basal body-associated protein FliL
MSKESLIAIIILLVVSIIAAVLILKFNFKLITDSEYEILYANQRTEAERQELKEEFDKEHP